MGMKSRENWLVSFNSCPDKENCINYKKECLGCKQQGIYRFFKSKNEEQIKNCT